MLGRRLALHGLRLRNSYYLIEEHCHQELVPDYSSSLASRHDLDDLKNFLTSPVDVQGCDLDLVDE